MIKLPESCFNKVFFLITPKACNVIKNEALTQVLFWEFCLVFKNLSFKQHLRVTNSMNGAFWCYLVFCFGSQIKAPKYMWMWMQSTKIQPLQPHWQEHFWLNSYTCHWRKLKLSFLLMVNAAKFQKNCKTNLYLLEKIIVQSVTNLGYHSKNFVWKCKRKANVISSGASITSLGELK